MDMPGSGMNPLVMHELLFGRYGELGWWPAETPYEMMVGAVLTQNTAWGNVGKAIAGFQGRLSPCFVEAASMEELADIIRPSGFFNQKAVYLKALTGWYKGHSYSVENVQKLPLDIVRCQLLEVRGVGYETADSILLYAFGYRTFVVDAYTKRLVDRLGLGLKPDYHAVKAYFEDSLPADSTLYNNCHAMIVQNAKEHCRSKPVCEGCPLEGICPASSS